MEKKKSPVFSKEIDSAINGFALATCFIGTGVFLLLEPNYFHFPLVSYIIGAILGALGFLGIGSELSKLTKFQGMSNFIIGFVFVAIWLIAYIKLNVWWVNIISFIFLFIGEYAIILGLFQSIYAIIRNRKTVKEEVKDKKQRNGEVVSQIVLLLTQLCALAIGVLNVIKAASISE